MHIQKSITLPCRPLNVNERPCGIETMSGDRCSAWLTQALLMFFCAMDWHLKLLAVEQLPKGTACQPSCAHGPWRGAIPMADMLTQLGPTRPFSSGPAPVQTTLLSSS